MSETNGKRTRTRRERVVRKVIHKSCVREIEKGAVLGVESEKEKFLVIDNCYPDLYVLGNVSGPQSLVPRFKCFAIDWERFSLYYVHQ